MNPDEITFVLPICMVASGDGTIILRIHPLKLQLPVIICGRSPDIQVHGTVQKFPAVQDHAAEHTFALVIAICETGTGNHKAAVIFLNFWCVRSGSHGFPKLRGLLIFPVIQGDFVKAQAMSRRTKGVGLLQEIIQFQVIPGPFREPEGQFSVFQLRGGQLQAWDPPCRSKPFLRPGSLPS